MNLFSTNCASDNFVVNVRRAGQAATACDGEKQHSTVFIEVTSNAVLQLGVHTDILGPSHLINNSSHEIARVEKLPAMSAHVGDGDHQSGGERGPTHRAHSVFVVVRIDCFVFWAVQQRPVYWSWTVAEDGGHGQTQVVGSSPGVLPPRSSHHSRVDELGVVGTLGAAPVDEGGALGVLDVVVVLGDAGLEGLQLCVCVCPHGL